MSLEQAARRPVLVALLCSAALLAGCSPRAEPQVATPTDSPPATDSSPATGSPSPTEVVPTPEDLPNGSVVEVDGGLLYIIWDGVKEQIGQPAPFDDATLDELGLRVEDPISELTARDEPDPRTFWVVYPADGPEARLHLAVADRLYPVQPVEARSWQVDRLPDATDSLLNRMRPAD
jgi:hypothetical protein